MSIRIVRIKRLVGTVSWKHAIGEVVLIVIGVTIALAANSWYERRQLRNDESALLATLKTTISEDLVELQSDYETLSETDQVMLTLAPKIDQLEGSELSGLVDAVLRFTTVAVRFGPYETLKARGIDRISDPALRGNLTSLYEDVLPTVVNNTAIDREFSTERVMPFVLQNFRMNETSEWVLADSPSSNWQSDLATLARFRPGNHRRYGLPTLRKAMDLMSEVLKDIEKRLE